MSQPISVGQVEVEILGSVSKLAKSIRKELQAALKDIDVNKAIQDSLGGRPLKVKVDPQVDTDSITAKVRGTRVPKVPVQVDPLMRVFQQEVQRQTNALARTVNAKVPVGADTAPLRNQLRAELAAVQSTLKAKIPTEPADKAAYEARLKAMLAEVSARVKQNVKLDVDRRGLAGISTSLNPLRLIPSVLSGAFRGLSQAMQESGSAAVRMGGSIIGAVAGAAGPIASLGGGILAVIGALGGIGVAATVAIPAVNALAGALAALPGLAAGIGAAVGTLALGFKGISDAFKPKTGGGGGGGGGAGGDAAGRARRIAAAERGVESARRGIAAATRGVQQAERGYADAVRQVGVAQERSRKAQDAVNRARREAREDIEDLDRALRGAKLSEEEATLAVTDALRELNQARETGILPDIQAAELAYRRAQLSLEDAKDSVGDLTEEQADSATKGVEGSDKVQAALADQADALQGVRDAQRGVLDAQDALIAANDGLKSSYDGLASAQDALIAAQQKAASGGGGGGGGLAKEIVKLAPAAQRFVDAIKALKPAFEDLRLDVQQRLFAGLDKTVTRVGQTWIPALKTTLGRYADTFNTFFKNLGAGITAPRFVSDLQTAAEGARQGMQAIGTAVTTSLVPAFGRLAAASAPFLKALGDEIAAVVTEFSNWILQADRSKSLQAFFTNATASLHDIFVTGKLVVKIVGQLFQAITGSGQSTSGSAIDRFNAGLQRVSDWLGRAENQEKIRGFIDDLISLSQRLASAASQVNSFLTPKGQDAAANSLGAVIGRALVAGVVAGIKESLRLNVETIAGIATWIVDTVKGLLGIRSPSTVMAAVGRDVVAGLVNGVAGMFGVLRSRMLGVRSTILGALANAGSLLLGAGRNVVAGLVNGVVSWYGRARTAVLNLRAYAINAVSSAGSWLYNAGRAVLAGLVNGLWSRLGDLGSALSYVTNYIRDHKGPIDKDRRLLIPAGQAIMDGLRVGIDSRRRALGADLAAVTDQIAGGVGADLFARAAGGVDALSAQLALATPAPAPQPLLAWSPTATGDKLLDAMAGLIEVKHRGDPVAALSRR